jgi:hypothetical protein
MVKLAVLAAAALILAIIVGALIVFPLLQVRGFKIFRRRS